MKKRLVSEDQPRMVIFESTTQQRSTMNKSNNFTGQPILNQLLLFLDMGKSVRGNVV